MNKIEWTQECDSCKGSGLYVGLGERDGLAVLCSRCMGQGYTENIVEYNAFAGRKNRDGITHVIYVNPGIVLTPELVDEAVPVQEWQQNGNTALHKAGRSFFCPASWAQRTGLIKSPNWPECVRPGIKFTSCPHYETRAKCWESFDNGDFVG